MRGYRARSDSARATIAPTSTLKSISMNSTALLDMPTRNFLLETAKQRGVALTGDLHECEGCSMMVKGRKKPIAKTTKSRADKRGGHAFHDVCGPKSVHSTGEKQYILCMVKYYFSRFFVVY